MKNPVRTEAEAFSFVLVAAVCFLALALAAIFGGRWVGIAVSLALVLGIAVGVYLKSEPKVRESAVWERREPDATRRILVVADGSANVETVREEVVRRSRGAVAEVLVVVPGRTAGARYDPEAEAGRAEAARRAEALAAAFRNGSVAVRATVGDVDALKALREALRGFEPDEVVVSAKLRGDDAA